MSYQFLEVEYRPPVAIVTFNRPEKANALHSPLIEEIERVALAFADDIETRAVVFTGAGRHFTSGADLTDREPPHALVGMRRRRRIGERAIRALLGMDQITIAAWNGAAMGGGACIATALDFRIGAPTTFICYPEIDIGVNLMWSSLPLAVRLVGPARAKRLVIGGERFYGETLERWGVLDELVGDEGDILPRALEWARHYAAKAPVPAQMIKRSVNALAGALDAAIMHADFDQHLLASGTADAKEAVEAYLAGRKPRFRGE